MTTRAAFEDTAKTFRLGKSEMDNKMAGGIPSGSLVLVEGQSDAGKSVLVQHYIQGALDAGAGVAYYTNENTVKSLLRQMDSLGLDVVDQFLLGYFAVYPITAPESKEMVEYQLVHLLPHMARLPREIEVVMVDSITNLVTHSDEKSVIDFFARCKSLCNQGMTIFLVVHSHGFSEQMLIRVRSMCDAHFHLKVTYVGDRMVKTLEVAKVRGAEKTTGNVITFDVEPGLGIKLIPISMAKA